MLLGSFQMNIYKNKFLSRFGLMHMIATNLCVWLNVLILETSHEILHGTAVSSKQDGGGGGGHDAGVAVARHLRDTCESLSTTRRDFCSFSNAKNVALMCDSLMTCSIHSLPCFQAESVTICNARYNFHSPVG